MQTESRRVLCTVCARGGSKGVPGKNVRSLLGKPLLQYTIDVAREAGLFDAVSVSSDSEEILEVARVGGADALIRRPDELATDSAGKIPAIRHCVIEAERILGIQADVVVDLDATSPLRRAEDVCGAVETLDKEGAANVVSVVHAHRSPYFNMVELGPDAAPRLVKAGGPIVARQQAPECYDLNASIYVWRRAALFDREGLFHADTRIFVMADDTRWDIDTEIDWRIVEFLMASRSEEGDR